MPDRDSKATGQPWSIPALHGEGFVTLDIASGPKGVLLSISILPARAKPYVKAGGFWAVLAPPVVEGGPHVCGEFRHAISLENRAVFALHSTREVPAAGPLPPGLWLCGVAPRPPRS